MERWERNLKKRERKKAEHPVQKGALHKRKKKKIHTQWGKVHKKKETRNIMTKTQLVEGYVMIGRKGEGGGG